MIETSDGEPGWIADSHFSLCEDGRGYGKQGRAFRKGMSRLHATQKIDLEETNINISHVPLEKKQPNLGSTNGQQSSGLVMAEEARLGQTGQPN